MKSLDESSFKALVCGVPNVGKSSFINAARQRYLKKGKLDQTTRLFISVLILGHLADPFPGLPRLPEMSGIR